MQATLAKPEILTRPGQLVSGIMPIKDSEALWERGEVTGGMARLKRVAPKLKPETLNAELRAAAGVSEEEVLKRGMKEMSKEFVEKGAEVCAKA
jgi:hypothetical protein